MTSPLVQCASRPLSGCLVPRGTGRLAGFDRFEAVLQRVHVGVDGEPVPFTVPASALGQQLTVELVEWIAPVSLRAVGGVVGGPVPSNVPAGEGRGVPTGLLVLGLLVAAGASVAARRGIVTS